MFSKVSSKLIKVFASHLGSFSLFLSAASEVFRFFCRPSSKLLTVFVGHLFAVFGGHLESFLLFLLAILVWLL